MSTEKVLILFTKCKTALNCKTDFYNFERKEHWQRGKWEENCFQKSHSNALTGQMCGGIQVKFIRFFPFLVTECSSPQWWEVEGYCRTETTDQHSWTWNWLPILTNRELKERIEISVLSEKLKKNYWRMKYFSMTFKTYWAKILTIY